MGLDGVEFIIAVKELFQIAIPDEDACRLRTPGNVVDYILNRVGSENCRTCLEQRAFYRLRQASMQVFAKPRKAIRTNTQWEDFIPYRNRRHNWRLLHQTTGTPQWPRLIFWNKIPKKVATVGGTARYLAENAPAALKSHAHEGWSRPEVEESIKRIMKDLLAITDFRWDQEFVRDLGVD